MENDLSQYFLFEPLAVKSDDISTKQQIMRIRDAVKIKPPLLC